MGKVKPGEGAVQPLTYPWKQTTLGQISNVLSRAPSSQTEAQTLRLLLSAPLQTKIFHPPPSRATVSLDSGVASRHHGQGHLQWELQSCWMNCILEILPLSLDIPQPSGCFHCMLLDDVHILTAVTSSLQPLLTPPR